MRKSKKLYVVMITVWYILLIGLWTVFIINFNKYDDIVFKGDIEEWVKIVAKVMLVLCAIFISYFWFNGTKDFIYVIWYYTNRKRILKEFEGIQEVQLPKELPRVLLVYCTCNDFDAHSLDKCIEQSYDREKMHVAILDDSSKTEYIEEIDNYASEHKSIELVRRITNKGYKAGNINNYLLGKDDYDYVVILDSDEILDKDFIVKALKYFKYYDNIGLVQASHKATRNRNAYMDIFHIGVNSHWPTYQSMKHIYGFTSMLGHGAMISKQCYNDVGGFPELVAEDLCFSIEARNKGYMTAFAPDIVCEEEYPVDYLAFKKRHSKWTQGNLEFIKKYTGKIMHSKMKWFEKLDIVMFTYNLPLTALFAFYIILNIVILPVLGVVNVLPLFPVWLIVPTIVFFFAPMLNDLFAYFGKMNIFKLLRYQICVIFQYGSMMYTSLKSALLGMFGKKAVFVVTPKANKKVGLLKAIVLNLPELLFATTLSVLSFIFTGSILPVILIAGSCCGAIFLSLLGNIRKTKRT